VLRFIALAVALLGSASPALATPLAPVTQLAPFPARGSAASTTAIPVDTAPAVPGPLPPLPAARPLGGWLNGIVDDGKTLVQPWIDRAQGVMYVIIWLLISLSIVFVLARNAAQTQSVAAWGHVLPSLLMDMLFPLSLAYAAPTFVTNTLAVGLGMGSMITGLAIFGPSDMFHVFMSLIAAMVGAPFSLIAHPIAGWQDVLSAPARAFIGYIMLGLALVLSLFVLIIATLVTYMLLWVQLDCLIRMPFAMVLVAFSANRATSGLWSGALQAWMSSVMRLAMTTGICGIAYGAFRYFATNLANLNPLDYNGTVYGWFATTIVVGVIGLVTLKLSTALDSAISTHAMPVGIDVNKAVFKPAFGALASRVADRRSAAAKAQADKAA
jgi:hypothetical protein